MKIQELGADERPREKMLRSGPEGLSNAELLAILLRTGTETENAVEVARNLMKEAGGSLVQLSAMTVTGMKKISGIGPLKAVTVQAAIELGRRFACEGEPTRKVPITGALQVYRLMIPRLKGLDREQCWVVYLNKSNYVTGVEMLSLGGFSATTVDVQMIVRNCLEHKAAGMILVHNHPSGNPLPGEEDIRATGALNVAVKMMKISLLDHVIVSDSAYFSFKDEQTFLIRDGAAIPAPLPAHVQRALIQ